MHHTRWRRHGDPLTRMFIENPEERFLAKTERAANGCLLWTAHRNPNGYGRFGVGRTVVLAHRWAYEHWVGPIPKGFNVDHDCHNLDPACVGGGCAHRACVEPTHLVARTFFDNIKASPHSPVNRTQCPAGHPYSKSNTWIDRGGHRHCRTCHRVKQRNRARDIAAAQTHCAKGHALINPVVGKDGRRMCRVCFDRKMQRLNG